MRSSFRIENAKGSAIHRREKSARRSGYAQKCGNGVRAVLIDAKNPTEEVAQIDVGGHRVSDRRAGEEERRGESVQRWPMPPESLTPA